MRETRWTSTFTLFALLALVATGCTPSKDPKPDAGPDTDVGDSDADVPPPPPCELPSRMIDGVCTPPCAADFDCGKGKRCLVSESDINKARNYLPENLKDMELYVGQCIDAVQCTADSICASGEGEFYYCNSSAACVCQMGETKNEDGETIGHCKRVRKPCGKCTEDVECGNTEHFRSQDKQAVCVGGLTPEQPHAYCFQVVTSTCTCGKTYSKDGKTICAPEEPEVCEFGAFECCEKDYEAGMGSVKGYCRDPGTPICDTKNGICRTPCKYEFDTGKTVGCKTGQVCHVLEKRLDPDISFYARGRCGPPCKNNEECLADPDPAVAQRLEDLGYACMKDEKAPEGMERCRPTGCIDDLECEDAPDVDGQAYRGFCNRVNRSCICEPPDAYKTWDAETCFCRGVKKDGSPWVNPEEQTPFTEDCYGSYTCDADPLSPTANHCVEKTCIDWGGAAAECELAEFCCGENPDRPCKDLAGNEAGKYGECYEAPLEVFCKTCESHNACNTASMPVDMKDHLGRSPKDINLCSGPQGDATCIVTCDSSAMDCPRGFRCDEVKVNCKQGDPTGCDNNPDACTANCVEQNDGSIVCACICYEAYTTEGCPAGTRCTRWPPTQDPNDSSKYSDRYCVYGDYCLEDAQGADPEDPNKVLTTCDVVKAGP